MLEIIENYSDKSFILTGDSKHLMVEIKNIGAIWLNHKKAWCFSNKKLDLVKQLISKEISSKTVGCHNITKEITLDVSTTQKKPKYSKKDLKAHMLKNIPELLKSIIGETNISSVVINDTKYIKDDGKRYIMLGCGCGFSYIKCDGRSKLGMTMIKDAASLKVEIETEMLKSIDKDFLKSLENCGNPIRSMLAQNLNYKAKYNGIAMRYMDQFDIKGLTMKNFDD